MGHHDDFSHEASTGTVENIADDGMIDDISLPEAWVLTSVNNRRENLREKRDVKDDDDNDSDRMVKDPPKPELWNLWPGIIPRDGRVAKRDNEILDESKKVPNQASWDIFQGKR